MPKSVVVLTIPEDLQAFAVVESLRRRGLDPFVWFPADFPTHEKESISLSGERLEFTLNAGKKKKHTFQADTVWYRRIGSNSDFSVLHPADRLFAWSQCRDFREGSLLALFSEAFWVNPPATAQLADNKLYQQSLASRLGFMTPSTLFTNDPTEIRSFLRSHNGEAVYKAFPAAAWRNGEDLFACHTVRLTEADLVADELLAVTPGIYQALVPKHYEVRLTMIGAEPFAAKIFSQDTQKGRLDWRRAYDELRMEPTTLPAALVEACRLLMKRLNLVFGCFDFIVDPAGNYIFLEVNQQGQFLFIETYTDIPLLDAFTEFLIQGPNFSWKGSGPGIRYKDVADIAERSSEAAAMEHVSNPIPSVAE
jgi:glutathione synthase/RimK-type ligase-like ATP-grasp enzyme